MTEDDQHEKIQAYHARVDLLNSIFHPEQHDFDWQIASIDRHLTKQIPNQNQRRIYYKVMWFGGKSQWMNQDDLRIHDPYLIIRYDSRHNLINKPGYEWIRQHMDSDKEISAMLHAYKVAYSGPKLKFGTIVPISTKHAYNIDKESGTTGWTIAIKDKIDQINSNETFIVLKDTDPLPPGYKFIPYHCVYDINFDGRKKCRLVAGGHRTDPPKEDIYLGFMSIEMVRTCFFLAKMNGLQVCAGDVSNAFLYGKPHEKVYIIAGPEFGPDLQGKRLLMDKSLYGLKSSSARFHEHLSATLRKLGFKPSRADFDLWIKKIGNHYEYIACYVDDIIAFSKDPMKIMHQLQNIYKMKGIGKPQYYLGGDKVDTNEHWQKNKLQKHSQQRPTC